MFELRTLLPTDAECSELAELHAFIWGSPESRSEDAVDRRMRETRTLPQFQQALAVLGFDALPEHCNCLPLHTPRCPACGSELVKVDGSHGMTRGWRCTNCGE